MTFWQAIGAIIGVMLMFTGIMGLWHIIKDRYGTDKAYGSLTVIILVAFLSGKNIGGWILAAFVPLGAVYILYTVYEFYKSSKMPRDKE